MFNLKPGIYENQLKQQSGSYLINVYSRVGIIKKRKFSPFWEIYWSLSEIITGQETIAPAHEIPDA